jgi:hypothetical protein
MVCDIAPFAFATARFLTPVNESGENEASEDNKSERSSGSSNDPGMPTKWKICKPARCNERYVQEQHSNHKAASIYSAERRVRHRPEV